MVPQLLMLTGWGAMKSLTSAGNEAEERLLRNALPNASQVPGGEHAGRGQVDRRLAEGVGREADVGDRVGDRDRVDGPVGEASSREVDPVAPTRQGVGREALAG